MFRLSRLSAYLLTLILTLLTIGLRRVLDAFGDEVVPFALFYPLVLGCTLLGGFGTGLLSLGLSLVAVTMLWLEPRAQFAVDEAGAVNLVLFILTTGILILVGERLRTTLFRLRRSESRLGLAQKAGRVGMWNVNVKNGEVWWSDPFYEVTGIDPRTVPSITSFFERIHPADRDRVTAAFEEARAGLREFDSEFRFNTDDGRVIHLVGRAELLRDARGNPRRMTGVNFDVTSLRDAEKARDRATSLLRTFFDTLPGAAYAKDTEGRTLMGNRLFAAAVGHGPEEFVGKTDLELLADKAQARAIMDNDRRVMREGVTRAVEEDLVLPDGRLTHWLSVKTPFTDPDGNLLGIIGVSLDVTERRRAEERLRLLAHEVDHRAKNLLGVVQSVVRLTDLDDVAAFKTAVTGRIQALARAHSLLAASRWEGVTIGRLVEEELKPFTTGQPDRVSAAGPLLMLRPGAAQTVGMALHELATNAAKYGALTAGEGRVDLSWQTFVEGGQPRLEFVWSESGGPPVTAPTRTGFGSTVIAGSIRQQLGGEVTFDWQPTGLVCRFAIPLDRLDARHEYRMIETEAGAQEPPPVSLAGKRVLIVEDEALIALSLADAMIELGCEVVGPAGSSEDALALLKSGGADLAILDINLGGGNSRGVARAVRALGIPFVYCTGYSEPALEDAADGLEAEVVTKPAGTRELADALRRALAGRAAGEAFTPG